MAPHNSERQTVLKRKREEAEEEARAQFTKAQSEKDARAAKHAALNRGFAARHPKLVDTVLPVASVVLVAVTVAYLIGGSAASAAFASSTRTTASFGAAESFARPWDQASFHFGYAEEVPNLGAAIDDAGTPENGILAGGIARA